MADESINPNVVLTADNAQYDQAMMQSAGSTDQLAKSVDSLTAKIKGMTKSAGKGLIGIAAADVAMITAATTAWASYEKQVSQLNAQSAILTRNQTQQKAVFKDYENAVRGLREEYGTTTAEAAKLTQTLSKMTSLRQTRELGQLSKVFVDMSKATGESSDGLATSLTSLQKVMGTDINARNTRKYADQFTYLSAQTQSSATQLIDFTKQLAPIGRQIGITQTELAGFATAFSRAGEDGFQAANVFNKIVNDISYSMQSGSPEIAKFANIVGVTQQQFKEMSGAEQMVSILESLQRMGPRAATELNRLGLDGTRSMRSITAVINEAGGIRQALNLAGSDEAKGSSERGAAAAMEGLSDEFEKLREEMKMTAESMATWVGPVMTKFVGGMEKAAETMRKVVQGPFGEFAQLLAGILAPLAGGAGALLLFAGALLKIAGAFTLFRNSGAYGFREGIKGAAPITRGADGTFMASPLATRGQQIAREGTWFQRGLYNTGAYMGSGIGSMRSRYIAERMERDPNYVPRSMRQLAMSPINAAAGGTGWAMRNFLIPQYDQMRYADPTKRTTWLQQVSPFARAMDRADLSRAMGRTGTAMAAQDTVRQAIRQTHMDPMLTNAERDERLRGLRQLRSEHQERINSSKEQEAAAKKVIDSHKTLSDESKKTAGGMRGLFQSTRQTAGAMTGAVMGGARSGMQAFAGSPMALPAVGAMGMATMAATGVQNNMLMFGAMGSMFGKRAGVAGLGLGLGVDVYQQHKEYEQGIKDFDTALKSGTPSDIYAQSVAARKRYTDVASTLVPVNPDQQGMGIDILNGFTVGGYSPGQIYGGAKAGIESALTGDNVLEERKRESIEANEQTFNLGIALSELSARTEGKGKQIPYVVGEGAERSWERLDTVVQKLQPAMDELGITMEEITSVREAATDSRGRRDWQELMDQLTAPGSVTGVYDRLKKTSVGAAMIDSPEAKKAIRYQEDVGAFYDATNSMLAGLRDKGLSYQQIIKGSEQAQNTIGDVNSREYELMMALSGRAQSMIQFKAPFQTRTAGFQAQTGAMTAIMGQRPDTPENAEQMEATRDAFVGAVTQQYQYFQNLLYQQREFNVSQARAQEDFGIQRERMDQQYHLGRERAQDDFHLGRVRQEQDYQLSRQRAEFDYNLSRQRGQDDYDRSVRRSRADFNRQRLRQERDFNHQVMLMVEQTAQQMYSIYDRVKVESTNSATYLLSNAGDQLERMQEQTKNLERLRGMGVEDDVIQQLGLTDTKNAQQLERFVEDLGDNPELVKKFNKQIKQRLKAARNLVTDESSTEWQEFRRQHELQRRRASADFERSVARGHKDFQRQMERMETDFRRSMNRQAEDYEKAQKRQQQDFSKSMKRGAEDYAIAVDQMTDDFGKSMRRAQADLERSAEEITGSLTTMLRRATNELGGNASEQAGIVLRSLRDLRREAGMEGNSLMEVMSEIFGFDFKPVKVRRPSSHGDDHRSQMPAQNSSHRLQQELSGGHTSYAGGVLPGYSPGKDIHQFHSATAGDLHLSGGEAIMVPEWTQQVGGPAAVARMNAKARAGGHSFASGGVNPDRRVYMDGEPLSAISAAQLLLAERLMGANMNVMQGSWQPYTSYSGSSHMGPGVMDTGPGNFAAQAALRRAGFAAWGRNFAGAASAGSGAHVHSVSRIDPGARNHAQLSSFARGEDGLGGQDYGPNPPMLPDLLERLDRFMGIAVFSGDSKGLGRAKLNTILKDRYEKVERAAAKMKLLGGFPDGWWSKKINQMARKAYNEMAPTNRAWTRGGTAGSHGGMPQGPDHGSNQDMVRRAMLDQGWHQWPALYELVMAESGFNNRAQNPTSTAYGMFQFLDATWPAYGGHKTSDPWQQSVLGMRYIKDRYGDPRGAWNFHQRNNWYGDGAIFDGAQTIGIGEKGPEAVIPLNERGADFMSEMMRKTRAGLSGKSVGLTGSTPILANTIHSYTIDRSTTFTGDITVQANNPGELINQLKARQRVQALSQAALGGSRV